MNKWFYWASIIAFLLTSCASAKFTPVVNTVVFSFPNRDDSYYRTLINQFNVQNPGIIVRLDPVAGNKLSEQTGDVQVITWDINGEELTWDSRNYLNLKPFIDGDDAFNPEDFFPVAGDPFTINGVQFGIPYGMDLYALYYNQDIQKESIDPKSPWNWDNFLDTAAQLTDREKNIYGYTANEDFTDSLFFLYQNGGSLLDEDGKPSLPTSANIEALGWYGRLFTTLNVAPTVEQAQKVYGYSKDVFTPGIAAGKVGMWTAPFSARDTSGSIGASWSFEYGIMPLPGGKNLATSGKFEAYAISKDAGNKEASWKLIAFLSTQQHHSLIPARSSIATSLEYARSTGADATLVAISAAGNVIAVSPDHASNFIKARKAFLEAVSNVVKRVATPEQALKAGQELITP